MKNIFKILLILAALGAIAATVFLTGKVQETRKGAYSASAKLWFVPTEASLNVGDTLSVYLIGDVGSINIVSFCLKIAYSANLSIVPEDITVHPGFTNVFVKNVKDSALTVAAGFIPGAGETTGGVTGVLDTKKPLLKMKFKAVASGPAEIKLLNSTAVDPNYQVIYKTDNPDPEVAIKNKKGGNEVKVTYTVGGNTVLTPTTEEPSPEPTGEPTVEPTAIPTLIPTGEPTVSPDTPVLNFKVTLAGVAESAAVKRLPAVTVILEKGSREVAEFKDVILGPGEGAVFTGEVVLSGVSPGGGYTVKVRGPLHLARRFCKNNQNDRCSGSGVITLVPGENNFDFSGLALEPGDTPSPENNMARDYFINTGDFSRVKMRLGEENPEEIVLVDFDFNNIVNTRDIVLLLQTLSSKYGEE